MTPPPPTPRSTAHLYHPPPGTRRGLQGQPLSRLGSHTFNFKIRIHTSQQQVQLKSTLPRDSRNLGTVWQVPSSRSPRSALAPQQAPVPPSQGMSWALPASGEHLSTRSWKDLRGDGRFNLRELVAAGSKVAVPAAGPPVVSPPSPRSDPRVTHTGVQRRSGLAGIALDREVCHRPPPETGFISLNSERWNPGRGADSSAPLGSIQDSVWAHPRAPPRPASCTPPFPSQQTLHPRNGRAGRAASGWGGRRQHRCVCKWSRPVMHCSRSVMCLPVWNLNNE